jgi:CspA family cold shock protein
LFGKSKTINYNENRKSKGFGFIKEENGQEIFVHVTGLKEKIKENDSVQFEVQEGKKGLNAVNVVVVKE